MADEKVLKFGGRVLLGLLSAIALLTVNVLRAVGSF